MNDTVFIGVDGGASKTEIVVLNAAGEVLGEARGPAAALNVDPQAAWPTIKTILQAIAPVASVPEASRHMVVGIAGTEIASAYDAFVADAPPVARCRVVSDADIACAGAHALADGAIVTVGTGLVGWARRGGKSWRVGGWGFPHDDCGAGAWLGLQAVRHALFAADGRGPADTLSATLLAAYDDDPAALSSWACRAGSGDFARHARLVVDTATQGCAAADALLAAAGAHVSALAEALLGSDSELAFALVGGLASTLAPRLAPALQARLVCARHGAAHGAALLALHGQKNR